VEPACRFFVVVVEVQSFDSIIRVFLNLSSSLSLQTRLHFRFPYHPPGTEQGTGRNHPEGCSDQGRGLEGHFGGRKKETFSPFFKMPSSKVEPKMNSTGKKEKSRVLSFLTSTRPNYRKQTLSLSLSHVLSQATSPPLSLSSSHTLILFLKVNK